MKTETNAPAYIPIYSFSGSEGEVMAALKLPASSVQSEYSDYGESRNIPNAILFELIRLCQTRIRMMNYIVCHYRTLKAAKITDVVLEDWLSARWLPNRETELAAITAALEMAQEFLFSGGSEDLPERVQRSVIDRIKAAERVAGTLLFLLDSGRLPRTTNTYEQEELDHWIADLRANTETIRDAE